MPPICSNCRRVMYPAPAMMSNGTDAWRWLYWCDGNTCVGINAWEPLPWEVQVAG